VKPICAELYLSLGIPRILVGQGGVSSDGTFSIFFVKQNVRILRATRNWSGIIVPEQQTKPASSSIKLCWATPWRGGRAFSALR
jgi:hypothetical protein